NCYLFKIDFNYFTQPTMTYSNYLSILKKVVFTICMLAGFLQLKAQTTFPLKQTTMLLYYRQTRTIC
ncbi:MAG TPA: hypothetical protein VL443_19135, partial [Cyclobacteriaceae bacterium]|nr:hypothetical protein [Cyclobacteriaceae bacterium]